MGRLSYCWRRPFRPAKEKGPLSFRASLSEGEGESRNPYYLVQSSPMWDHRHAVYVLGSISGTFYIGYSGQLYERVMAHKRGEGSKFAARYGCVRLLYYETHRDVLRALYRETQIKSWSRAKKIALIESVNPEWKDLAAGWGKPISLPVHRDSSTPPASAGYARNDNKERTDRRKQLKNKMTALRKAPSS
jgi:putative endonuclease